MRNHKFRVSNQVVASSNILSGYESLVRPIPIKKVIPTAKEKFDVKTHILVPKHKKLTDKEKKTLLESYNLSPQDLPGILITDAAIADLDVAPNDIIKIERSSPTSKNTDFYRRVIK